MVMATFSKAERDQSRTPKKSLPPSLASSPYLEKMKLVDPPSPHHGKKNKSRLRAKSPFEISTGNRYDEYSANRGRKRSDGHKREAGLLLLPYEVDDLARNAEGNQTFDQQQQHKKISEWQQRKRHENDDDTFSDESSVGPEFAAFLDDDAVLQWPKRRNRKPRTRRPKTAEHSTTVMKQEEPEGPIFKLPPVNPTRSLDGGNDGDDTAMAKNDDLEDNVVRLSRQGSTRSRESRSAGSMKSLVLRNEVEQWTTVKPDEPEVPPLKLPPLNPHEGRAGEDEGTTAVTYHEESSGVDDDQLSQRSTSSLGSKSAGAAKRSCGE